MIGFGEKDEAVVLDRHGAYLAERGDESGDFAIAKSEQVEVARRAMKLTFPQHEKQRALEDEVVAVRRDAKPVEQPLGGVAAEDELEILTTLAREIEQPLPH